MRINHQLKVLIELKQEIDFKLVSLDFEKKKELLIWLTKSKEYHKLKRKDNQLLFMDIFFGIWLEEIKRPNTFQMQGDIFYGISSLDELERKYLAGKFLALRVENNMPEECIMSAINSVIEYQYSASALYTIIACETKERVKNVLKISRKLMDANQAVKAIGILERENEEHPGNDEIFLELANCWLEVQQLKKAYGCLCMIESKSEQIKEMITELEKLIGNENL